MCQWRPRASSCCTRRTGHDADRKPSPHPHRPATAACPTGCPCRAPAARPGASRHHPGASARTRNARLTAIRALFAYAAQRHPEHSDRVLNPASRQRCTVATHRDSLVDEKAARLAVTEGGGQRPTTPAQRRQRPRPKHRAGPFKPRLSAPPTRASSTGSTTIDRHPRYGRPVLKSGSSTKPRAATAPPRPWVAGGVIPTSVGQRPLTRSHEEGNGGTRLPNNVEVSDSWSTYLGDGVRGFRIIEVAHRL